MKEKVLYVNLPEGAKYRKVEVTEDGKVGIIYEEYSIKESLPRPTIKPVPLIGGTDVFQRLNGTPYWYCRIKGGRDEFMYLYFEDLTKNDLLYDNNGKKRKFITEKQKKFKANVLKALNNKPIEGYRWIPIYEPSLSADGELQYVVGETVLRKLNYDAWEKLFDEYSPENGSQQASVTTYFLLLLRWLKDGIATLEQLADNSQEIGHYWDSIDSNQQFELTGQRFFGGLYGFVGNTYKIVKDSKARSGCSLVGSAYTVLGKIFPVSDMQPDNVPRNSHNYANVNGVGLLELTK